jgi:hypothetical protein
MKNQIRNYSDAIMPAVLEMIFFKFLKSPATSGQGQKQCSIILEPGTQKFCYNSMGIPL